MKQLSAHEMVKISSNFTSACSTPSIVTHGHMTITFYSLLENVFSYLLYIHVMKSIKFSRVLKTVLVYLYICVLVLAVEELFGKNVYLTT